MHKFHFFVFLTSVAFAAKTPVNEDHYWAAVVEYHSLDAGNDSLTKNAEQYVNIIRAAGNNADILIFPEVGLLLNDHYKTFIEINDSIAPADDPTANPALKMISQEAKAQGIYVVINIHEKNKTKDQTLRYNTNVVFNRTGHIIARYRKFNLFAEPLNITETPEHVYFDTDFGVRFGTFTCFDIMFEQPALELIRNYNVTDIVYPTHWYSSLPFLTAAQTQAGWAYANNVTLLAAGGNRPDTASTGSGLFAGRSGPVTYLQTQRNQTVLLYAKIFKKGKSGDSAPASIRIWDNSTESGLSLRDDPVLKKEVKGHLLTPDKYNPNTFKNISDQTNANLTSTELYWDEKICHGEFCCHFTANVTFNFKKKAINTTISDSSNPYLYRLAIFDGRTMYNQFNAGIQFCGVISCLNNTAESCGKSLPNPDAQLHIISNTTNGDLYLYSTVFKTVSLKTTTLDEKGFAIPSLLENFNNGEEYGSLMNSSQFTFSTNKTSGNLQFKSDKLITGAIYGRVFSRDNAASGSQLRPSVLLGLLSLFLFYLFY